MIELALFNLPDTGKGANRIDADRLELLAEEVSVDIVSVRPRVLGMIFVVPLTDEGGDPPSLGLSISMASESADEPL